MKIMILMTVEKKFQFQVIITREKKLTIVIQCIIVDTLFFPLMLTLMHATRVP